MALKVENKGLLKLSLGKEVRMHIDKVSVIFASLKIGKISLCKDSCTVCRKYTLMQRKISGKASRLLKAPPRTQTARICLENPTLACRMRNSLISVLRVNLV